MCLGQTSDTEANRTDPWKWSHLPLCLLGVESIQQLYWVGILLWSCLFFGASDSNSFHHLVVRRGCLIGVSPQCSFRTQLVLRLPLPTVLPDALLSSADLVEGSREYLCFSDLGRVSGCSLLLPCVPASVTVHLDGFLPSLVEAYFFVLFPQPP